MVFASEKNPAAKAEKLSDADKDAIAGILRQELKKLEDGVLANLLAAAHCALAPCYARLVAAGGTLVAGGCLDAEADDVTAALRGYGFQRLEARSIEGWTTLAYEHAPLRDRA